MELTEAAGIKRIRDALKTLRSRTGEYISDEAADAFAARVRSCLNRGSVESDLFELLDVRGLSYKEAAAKLGFSTRHLMRYRKSMLAMVLARLGSTPVAIPARSAQRSLELGYILLKHGRLQDAFATVRAILDEPLERHDVVDALAMKAKILAGFGTFDAAEDTLEQAERFIARDSVAESNTFDRTIAMARSAIAYRKGHYVASITIAEAALAGRSLSPLVSDPREARSLARDLMFLAMQHEENSSAQRCLALLDEAEYLLRFLNTGASAEMAMISVQRTWAKASIPTEIAGAIAAAEGAFYAAESAGLVYELVWANLANAVLREVIGRPQDGLAYATAALSIARRFLAEDELLRVLLLCSRVMNAAGHSADAHRLIQEAEPIAVNHPSFRALLPGANSRVLLAQGRFSETISIANEGLDILSTMNESHYVGVPLLSRGIARSRANLPGAREDLASAIDYLKTGGTSNQLLIALEESYNITGDPALMKQARNLRSLIVAPQAS